MPDINIEISQKESEDLTENIAENNENIELLRRLRSLEENVVSDKDFLYFRNNHIGFELFEELKSIDSQIEYLKTKRKDLAKSALSKMKLYSYYKDLCFFKDILDKPEVKLLLLLQNLEKNSVSELLASVFEGKTEETDPDKIMAAYYQKLDFLSISAKNKKSFWDRFSLSAEEEEPPKTEKEYAKRQIRDNTVRNIYKKYGTNMFRTEHMEELGKNLKKAGIDINDLSERKIREIINRSF